MLTLEIWGPVGSERIQNTFSNHKIWDCLQFFFIVTSKVLVDAAAFAVAKLI